MKALVVILQLVGLALLGAIPTAAWFTHPHIGWHTRVLWWHPGFDLPDSLKTQRDQALAASGRALAGLRDCRGQLDSQNASIAALSALSAEKMANAAAGVKAAEPVARKAEASAQVLSVATAKGPDVCARWEDADRQVKERLP